MNERPKSDDDSTLNSQSYLNTKSPSDSPEAERLCCANNPHTQHNSYEVLREKSPLIPLVLTTRQASAAV